MDFELVDWDIVHI